MIGTIRHPLVLLFADGQEKVVARCFEHPDGLVYFDLFWPVHGLSDSVHLIRGQLIGSGPWRIGSTRIRLLGCANTDPHLYEQYQPWQDYLTHHDYPSEEQIKILARQLGCLI